MGSIWYEDDEEKPVETETEATEAVEAPVEDPTLTEAQPDVNASETSNDTSETEKAQVEAPGGKEGHSEGEVSEDDLPEKLKGKSAADIAKMYAELEKDHGRLANEVGNLRKQATPPETVEEPVAQRVQDDDPLAPVDRAARLLPSKFRFDPTAHEYIKAFIRQEEGYAVTDEQINDPDFLPAEDLNAIRTRMREDLEAIRLENFEAERKEAETRKAQEAATAKVRSFYDTNQDLVPYESIVMMIDRKLTMENAQRGVQMDGEAYFKTLADATRVAVNNLTGTPVVTAPVVTQTATPTATPPAVTGGSPARGSSTKQPPVEVDLRKQTWY